MTTVRIHYGNFDNLKIREAPSAVPVHPVNFLEELSSFSRSLSLSLLPLARTTFRIETLSSCAFLDASFGRAICCCTRRRVQPFVYILYISRCSSHSTAVQVRKLSFLGRHVFGLSLRFNKYMYSRSLVSTSSLLWNIGL